MFEAQVIHSEEVNAFVLPGGKVCIFTGILSVMENECGLAAVLGHEIGHVVARIASCLKSTKIARLTIEMDRSRCRKVE